MAGFGDVMKGVLKTVAPTMALALPGPLGPIASAALKKALGVEPTAPDQQVEDALLKADPSTLLALKQAEINFQQFLKDADIKLEQLGNDDRASARERQVSLHDRTPAVLAAAVTVGFFGVLGVMLFRGLPAQGEQALLVMLGALGGAWASIIAYFFGSSSSSRNKDMTISTALKGK